MNITERFLPENPRARGLLMALIGVLLISFDSVFVCISGTSGVNTAFLFGLFTFISMSIIIKTSQPGGICRTLKKSGWVVALSGFLVFGSATSLILSYKNTSVANTVFIMGSRPVATAIASWLFLREKSSKQLVIAMILVLSGIGVVTSGSLNSGNLKGDLLAILSVVFLALNGTLQRKYKSMSRMAVVGIGGLLIALILFFFVDFSEITCLTWIVMALNGLVSAPIGRVLNMSAVRYVPAAEAAMVSISSSVFAPTWAYLFFREVPPMMTIWGGLIILSTISIYILTTIKGKTNIVSISRKSG